MAAAPFNQNSAIAGLNSYSVALPNVAPYVFQWKSQIPTIVNGGGASALIMTITDTTASVTVYTGPAGAEGGSCVYALPTAQNVIQFALTSANAADAGLNAVKTELNISQGVS
jgi:hypothetical protein